MPNPIIPQTSIKSQFDPITLIPRLGVGLLYNPSLPTFLRSHIDAWDYVEIIPDMFWSDHGVGRNPRYVEIEAWVEFLEWLAQHRPIVAHNISLSLGSAELFDEEYVNQILQWYRRYSFPWQSDHLSFVRVHGPEGHDHNAGLAVPVPYDYEVLNMIAERIAYVQSVVPTVFIIENNVYFIDIPDQDMSEPEFLNRLTDQTGCGLLLDIHNLYANSRNHGFDARDFIRQLNLSKVVEMHIAGGSELGGMYTDSHAGPCPEPVWELLEYVVPNAPNLCGITFEFHESYYPLLKTDGILAELNRAREIWNRYH